LRRARELLAQIVLFGVEFGVGIDGASVSKSVSKSVSAPVHARVEALDAGFANRIGIGGLIGDSSGRGEKW